ncbi:carbohydrate-binding protein [Pseudobutyrivibrio ruminis]|uniref:Carbohydrate binding module (Family 6) n=1 Tax=Pseudobutyrivibrio ruminis TaxID=46206 RepID=A0A2G3DT55_9FIRM|nr:carbohydrate-binding protein [Pseudobutyrivibrio ruminis]PHU34216.1 hypothetical protein CSX01_11665 [Pseudobutyrivibrio ruminis]
MKRKNSIALGLLLTATTVLAPSLKAHAAPQIVPYGTVEAELDFTRNVKEVFTEEDGVTTAVSLENGNYFSMRTVNFSKGVSKISVKLKADGPGIIVIHKGDENGETVGTIRYSATDGYKEFSADVTNLADTDYFTFENKVGNCAVDSWKAVPGETQEPETPETPEEPDTPPVQPPSSEQGAINPYEKVEAENATSDELTNAMVVPSKDKVVINENGKVLVQNVNFSQGVSSINVYAQSSKPMVKLNVYIDDADAPIGTAAVGTNITNATAINVSSNITGSHNVYFVAQGGSVTLDGWQAVAAEGGVEQPPVEEPPVVEPPVGDTVNPYSAVEAESAAATDMSNARVTPKKDAVSLTQANSYVAYKNVNFAQGVESFDANVSATAAAMLEVRLDSATGDKVAAFRLDQNSTITTKTAKALSTVTGTHDVYFVVAGGSGVTLDSWVAKTSGTVEEPPVVEPPVGETINPYEKVEAEIATDLTSAMVTPSKDKVVINENGSVTVQNVDFSQGVSSINAYAQSSKPGVSLNVYIDDAETPAGTTTVGPSITNATTINVSSAITGVHKVRFEAKGGSVTLDGWQAVASGEEPPVVEPPVGDTINPYEKVEAEIATDLTSAMVTPSKDKVVINENGSVTLQNVDFSQGVSSINAYAQSSKPGVSLNVYIDNAETPAGTVTVGPSITNATAINVSSAITGVHKVRFEAKGGSVTLDGWQAVASGEEPPVVEPPVGDTVNPYSAVEAESAAATDMSNARVTPKKDAVSLTQANSYVAIKNVNFANGVSEFSANVSASTAGMLEIRLDSATGDKVAAFRLDQNGTITTKTTKALATVTGTHDVYFVVAAGSGITLDSWTAKAAEGEEPPVVEPPVEGAINPYAKVEAEIATAEQLTNAMIVPSKDKVVINENGYVLVQNIDFSKGVSAFNVYAQSSKPMVSLNVYIDDAQTPAGTVSIGTDITKPTTITVSTDITGVHYVYFEAKGGSVTLDGWQAAAAGDQPPVEPPVGDTVDPYRTNQAENAASTDMSGAMVTPKKDAVSLAQTNSYVAIKNVNFAKGVAEFNANVSAGSAAMLEVRLDSATGDKVAAFRLAQNSTITTQTTKALANVTGTHDVYFVVAAGSGITLDSWSATASDGGVVEPPVTGTINPYAKVEAEIATPEQLTSAMITPSKDKVVINENGYVLVQNIDFSQGVSAFNVYAQASKPKVNLNVYIDDSKTPAGTVAVGTDITKPVTINVSSDITGVHYVYFEAKGGSVTFDGWQAAKAGEQPPVNPPATNVNPYSSVDATTASLLSGALVTPSKTAVNITPNGSAGTQNVNFSDGVSQFVITASSTSTGKIEVRLNSAAGPLLGSATISGDSKEYTITASKNITGKQTIYFVNSGSGIVNVYSWKATAYSEPIVNPDPPVVQTGMDLTYTINSWTDGYQVSFKVTNKSGSTKNSWKVKVKKSDINLTQSWCVNVSQEGDYYVFTPMSWNSTLTNGQTTEFGIIGRGQVGSTINYIVE